MHLIWRRIGQGRKGETHPLGTSAYGIRVLKMIDPRWLEEESLDLQGQGLFLSEVASLTRNTGGDPSFEYHVRPPASTRQALGTQEKGLSIRISRA